MHSRIKFSTLIFVLALALAPVHYADAFWGSYQYDTKNSSKSDTVAPSAYAERWVNQHPESGNGSAYEAGIAVGPDGMVYTADWDDQGFAIDPTTGNIEYTFQGIGACCAPPTVGPDGTVYFLGNGITAWTQHKSGSTVTYELKWSYPDAGGCCSGISIGPDGTVYVNDGWTTALDPNPTQFIDPVAKTVDYKWRYTDGDNERFAAFDNTTAYVVDPYTIYALDTTITGTNVGKLKWSMPITNDLGPQTVPVVGGTGLVYVPDGNNLIAIDPTSIPTDTTVVPLGAVRTVATLPSNKQIGYLAADNVDLTSANTGTMIAVVYSYTIDPNTQEKIWNMDTGGEVDAINVASGNVAWTYPISGNQDNDNWSPRPIIDANGAVYIQTVDFAGGVDIQNHLYAINNAGVLMFERSDVDWYRSDARGLAIGDQGDLYFLVSGAIKALGLAADVQVAPMCLPSPVGVNKTLTCYTPVANAGPDTATNVVARVAMPAGFTGITVSTTAGACTVSGLIATCDLGNMDSDGSVLITTTGTAPSTAESVQFSAAVKTDSKDTVPSNDSGTIPVTVQ